MNAGYFTYKLDHTEGRIALGKYHLYVQVFQQMNAITSRIHIHDFISKQDKLKYWYLPLIAKSFEFWISKECFSSRMY